MNKQEAIEKIKNIDTLNINDRIAGQQVDMVIKNQVLDLVSQIDEPQKVVVPKVIGDLIEKLKIDEYTIGEIGAYVYDDEEQKWIDDNEELFYRAFLDGYEIEQEKLYTVEIPNNGGTLVLASIHHAIKLVDGNKHFPGKFTKESIEYAGFGWVFDCDGVKVVEVSDEV
ncbi:TPA: DUF1642 domain-containing protein [Streptococcus suis]|uniref:DUF1642 domain-containing protein n=1 Tax=Streptococcus suis TaxID=1307 RepID=UPI0003FCCF97|nr:DUF1642 domain-containing protein [Streptococcus suis]MDW8593233.1 DUF1642 domain-containing protein [Streptococcus suis]MDW8622660.1 DUF1642 domain-containing protein [Streptococcus suis]NQJ99898.1 DUF1642 domain-containing protein [Streptococcus suis]NQK03688.1 DUF1642 domain-containing protein [Streptococcus suis]NQK14427.1 DUF1642 domain-containing protein [Streptococcus suis]